MSKLIKKIREFQDLLRSKDKDFMEKVNFSMAYNSHYKKYEVQLLSSTFSIDLQEYFNLDLGGEEFAKKALDMGVYSLKIGV